MSYETKRAIKEKLLRIWNDISPHRGLSRLFPILRKIGDWLGKPPPLSEVRKATIRTSSVSFQLNLLPEDPSISPRMFAEHIWEEHVTSVLQEEVRKTSGSVLDIGAHIGYYSVMAGLLMKARGNKDRVFAFEPLPQNFETLKKNIDENDLSSLVTLIPKGAGDRDQKCVIYGSDPSDTSDRFLFKAPGAKAYGEVESVRVGDYFARHLPGELENIRLVKMDIEGYEPFACRGMEELLTRPDIRLFTEMNFRRLREAGSSAQDYTRQLLSYGFKIFVIELHSKPGHLALTELNFDLSDQGEDHLDLFCRKG